MKSNLTSRFWLDLGWVALTQFVFAIATLYLKNIYPVWSSPIWPASGLALAFTLIRGPRMLGGVYLGLVPTQFFFWGTQSYLLAIFAPLGNVAETYLAWLLLRKVTPHFSDRLKTPKDIAIFLVLAPWLPSLLSAFLVQGLLQLLAVVPPERFLGEVVVYSLGNATGILLVTPMILVWRNSPRFFWRSPEAAQLILVFSMVLSALALYAFHFFSQPILLIILVPMAIWAAWSTGLRGATLLCGLLACLFFSFEGSLTEPFTFRLAEKRMDARALELFQQEQESHPHSATSSNRPHQILGTSLVGTVTDQVSAIGFLFLTLLPLGAAADTLRNSSLRDQRAMQVLNSSFWEWTQQGGLVIENQNIARQFGDKVALFRRDQKSGVMLLKTEDPLQPSYLSHWVATESNERGEPTAASGILQNLQAEEKQKEAEAIARIANLEAQTLRAHLNPHLLFNCLTGLRALIESDPPRAKEFTNHLARFLRSAVNSQDTSLIPLRTEVDICRDFLSLETMRGKNLAQELSMESGTQEVLVPPLCLQVLLENACKHGEMPEKGPLALQITARWDSKKQLCLTVRQPGTLVSGWKEKEQAGLGLLRRQLHSAFGTRALFSLRQSSPNWVEAQLTFPREA